MSYEFLASRCVPSKRQTFDQVACNFEQTHLVMRVWDTWIGGVAALNMNDEKALIVTKDRDYGFPHKFLFKFYIGLFLPDITLPRYATNKL